MNILYVHNVGKIGGAERVTLDIIRTLEGRTHKAFLVTPEGGPLLDAARKLGARACVLEIEQPESKRPIQAFKGYRRWLKFLHENQIDLIHTGDLFVTRTLIQASKKLAIPLVCHVHFPIQVSALTWIFKTCPDNCHFVYCSQELHDKVAPKVQMVLKTASHQVIHNGVDVDRFKNFEPKEGLLPADKINIGIVANLQERKGHLDLVEAIAKLSPILGDIRVHIIGGDLFGESREDLLKARISELGLDEVFIFHGQVDNVRDYLNELDILVCASHEEAFPISILEAMSFGLPLASTDVNGIPEAVTNNQSGLLFKPHDPEAMAQAIRRLIESPDKRRSLGEQARRSVSKQFSLARFSENVRGLYGRLENLK